MTFGLVLLAAVLMWTMWICAFMHQMYPLARPTVPMPGYKVRCVTPSVCEGFNEVDCTKLLLNCEFKAPDPLKPDNKICVCPAAN